MFAGKSSWWFFVVVGVIGFGVGVLTSFGQTWLPYGLSPLANSAGSWCVAAFALCLLNRSPARGILLGVLALATMLAGYVAMSGLRGFPSASSTVTFWGLAAIFVGPFLGVGASWVGSADNRRAGLAFTPPIGILLGEGIYGFTTIADTTPAGFWIGQIVMAVAIAVVVALRVIKTPISLAYLIGGSILVAAVMRITVALAS